MMGWHLCMDPNMPVVKVSRKKTLITFITVCIFFIAWLGYAVIPYVFSLDYSYTRKDWVPYTLLTSNEVKNAPGLDDASLIFYDARDGTKPSGFHIRYAGKQNVEVLKKYLISLGYQEVNDPVLGKSWIANSTKEAYINDADEYTILGFLNFK